MANMQKYCRGDAQRITNHCTRDVEGVEDLVHRDKPGDYIEQRIAGVKHITRANAVHLADWVITMPQTLDNDKEQEFFRATYKFMCDRYGYDNIAYATIHRDEPGVKGGSSRPHIHIGVIPIVVNNSLDYPEKLSCKELFGRNELRLFHELLQASLEKSMGCRVDILNEATRDGNRSINDLKRGTAVEQVKALRKISAELEQGNEKMAVELLRQKQRSREQGR